MNVNIEFFDQEPIENLITCLNFKMDKVIYLGYADVMNQEAKELTRINLLNICHVTEVDFVEVSKKSLKKILDAFERIHRKERKQGNRCFFDLTGGEDLILAAMGKFSDSYKLPMHCFNICENEINVLNHWETEGITECVERQQIKLTLDDFIQLHGGKIKYNYQKISKRHLDNYDFNSDVKKIWKIARKNPRKWNSLSMILSKAEYPDEFDLCKAVLEAEKIQTELEKLKHHISYEDFCNYMEELRTLDLLSYKKTAYRNFSVHYKSQAIRECLIDAGTILELHTYYECKESKVYDDCRIGVHIEWDAFVDDADCVVNEVDVLLLKGNIPFFISCKNGRVDQMALYELDTVAARFGGKYAKKQLVAGQKVAVGYVNRAREMGIEVLDS